MIDRPPLPGSATRSDFLWSVGVSVLAAIALIALALEAHAAGASGPIAFLASSLSCAALPVALRHPLGATLVQAVAALVLGLTASSDEVVSLQFPAVLIGVLVVQVGLVGVHHDWRVGVGVWWTHAPAGDRTSCPASC